jgi:O-antigen ligase
MLIFGLFSNVYNQVPLSAYLRLCQYLALIYFSSFWAQRLDGKTLDFIIRISLSVALAFQLVQFFFPAPYTSFLGTGRYAGLLGEPNFTAAFLLGMSSFAIFRKKYLISVAFMLLMIPPFSRGGFIALGLLLVALLLQKLASQKFMQVFSKIWLIALFSYPLAIYTSWHVFDHSTKVEIAKLSPRYHLHASYVVMAISNPLGVGTFQGKENILKYQKEVEFKNNPNRLYPWEPHNLYLQVLVEYGLLGSLSFFILLWGLLKRSGGMAIGLLAILSSFIFLNALSEIILYLYLSACCSADQKRKSDAF